MRHAIAGSIIGCSLLFTLSANAAVIRVDASAPPGGDGQTWQTARNDLRLALNSAVGGDEIWVRRGIYTPTSDGDRTKGFDIRSGVRVLGGFAGNETDPAMRPVDPDPAAADPATDTVLSGEINTPGFGDNTTNLVQFFGVNNQTLLERVVVTRGEPGSSFPSNRGGGISIIISSPVIRDVLVIDNAGSEGAGAYIANTSTPRFERCVFRDHTGIGRGTAVFIQQNAQPIFTDCLFANNQASDFGAAALYYTSGSGGVVERTRFVSNNSSFSTGAVILLVAGNLRFTDCVFESNQGSAIISLSSGAVQVLNAGTVRFERCTFDSNSGSNGGALNYQQAAVTITDCVFRTNSAAIGGAILSTGSTTIQRCRFENNTGGRGGAINTGGGLIEDCVFHDNLSIPPSSFGGGISSGAGNITVRNCEFRRNTAIDGGALAQSLGGDLTVDRCRFFDNSATSTGGAVWKESGVARFFSTVMARNSAPFDAGSIVMTGGNLMLQCCTVTGSSGGLGALFTVGSATISSSIFYNPGAEFAPGFGSVTASYSNIEGGFAGPGNIGATPIYVDAANDDFRLQSASPGVDAGDNLTLPVDAVFDAAGAPRRRNLRTLVDTGQGAAPIVDIGAYEFQPVFCEGDADGDGERSFSDITLILSVFGTAVGVDGFGDADGNALADFGDITAVLNYFGIPCPSM